MVVIDEYDCPMHRPCLTLRVLVTDSNRLTVSQKGNAQHYINTFIAHISTTTSPHTKIKGSVESQISVVYYGTLKK